MTQIRAAKDGKLGSWGKTEDFEPVTHGEAAHGDSGNSVSACVEDGGRQVGCKGRPEAKGYQFPDLDSGRVETPGCVALRSAHLRARPQRGNCGACKSKVRLSAQTASFVQFAFAHLCNGIRMSLGAVRECRPPLSA